MLLEWFLRFIPSGSTPDDTAHEQALPEGPRQHGGNHFATVTCYHLLILVAVPGTHGSFANASGFTINQPTMFDMQNPQFHQTIYQAIVNGPTGMTVHTCSAHRHQGLD